MAYSVLVAQPARDGLESALSYITSELGSPSAASNLLDSFEEKLLLLRDNPMLFGVDFAVSDAVGKQVRRFRVSNYLAFYVVNAVEAQVAIIAFCYGARDTVQVIRQMREAES